MTTRFIVKSLNLTSGKDHSLWNAKWAVVGVARLWSRGPAGCGPTRCFGAKFNSLHSSGTVELAGPRDDGLRPVERYVAAVTGRQTGALGQHQGSGGFWSASAVSGPQTGR